MNKLIVEKTNNLIKYLEDLSNDDQVEPELKNEIFKFGFNHYLDIIKEFKDDYIQILYLIKDKENYLKQSYDHLDKIKDEKIREKIKKYVDFYLEFV